MQEEVDQRHDKQHRRVCIRASLGRNPGILQVGSGNLGELQMLLQ